MEEGKGGKIQEMPTNGTGLSGKWYIENQDTEHSVFAGAMRHPPRGAATEIVQRCGSWTDIHMHARSRSPSILALKVRNRGRVETRIA